MLLSLIYRYNLCAGAMIFTVIELRETPVSELPVSCMFHITEKEIDRSLQTYTVALSGRYSGVDVQTCVGPHSRSIAWLLLQRCCLCVDQC